MKNISNKLLNSDRYKKKILAVTVDIFLCIFAVWFAFCLRLEDLILLREIGSVPLLISVSLAIPIFWIFGVYQNLYRFAGLSVLTTITLSICIYGLVYFLIISIYGIKNVPRSIGILQPIILFIGLIFSRFILKILLNNSFSRQVKLKNKENILIYGAGSAGRQILMSLENNFKFNVVGFLDDNLNLHNHYLLGKKIYDPKNIESLKKKFKVNFILFAIPSIKKIKKNKIIKRLSKYKLIVKTLPNISDIIDGKISVSDIKDFLTDDLLGRDQIVPDKDLLNKNIKSKSVLVTGAGGTIGSELCRQIIRCNPEKLILVEINEYALYKIHDELINLNKNLKIIPLLINVLNQQKIEKVIESFKIDNIYHAAAYKHVNLVESNICEGVRNNVFGTLSVTKASINKKIKNLVLVSTDKAVRPTNIMGASKRLAEICLQSLYHSKKLNELNFSIVRFGNVINSSGSAIPKFRQQIKNGGPITLTHPDVTRYFMTISEASQLVIQASALAKNSEVFVLDMGKSIKMLDLIKRMVNFSGLTIKDKSNPEGDIEIKIIGLRTGEKLYEELLIGDNPLETKHPMIKKINEPYIPYNELEKFLEELSILIENDKSYEVKNLLFKSINLNISVPEIVDYIYLENNINGKKNDLFSSKKNNNIIKIK